MRQILWLVIFHSLLSACLAFLVNVTVDDTLGDSETGMHFTYLPANQWHDGPTCTSCKVTSELNRSMAHDGTWHSSTTNQSPNDTVQLLASIPFYGSAVYVYCIIANTESAPDGHMNLTFLIDSLEAGFFNRAPTGDGTFEYNSLVFSNQSLPQGNHTLTLQNGHIGGIRSRVLLDYIVYTYENGLKTPPARAATSQPGSTTIAGSASSAAASRSNSDLSHVDSSGKIVGGVLGPIGFILLALVAFLWHRQRDFEKKASLDLSSPPPPPRRFPGANPVAWVRGWWHSPSSGIRSRFSFNPDLLVESMVVDHNDSGSLHLRRPPPVTTVLPIHPLPSRPDSTRPLQPNRETTPTPSLDPRNEQNQPLSIIEWQRRTQREADDIPPRFDVSDVEMSSYYDFSSDTPDALPPQPPRPIPRQFAVVNVS